MNQTTTLNHEHHHHPSSSSTYRAISPPTPAPSPQPTQPTIYHWNLDQQSNSSSSPQFIIANPDQLQTQALLHSFNSLNISTRAKFLNALLPILTLNELTNLSARILPRLKRDFLRELPIEISLHILSFVDDPRTLMRAGMVSRFWRSLVSDEATWKIMCSKRGFNNRPNQPIIPPLSLSERMERERKGRVATYRAGVVEERRRRSKKPSAKSNQPPQHPSFPILQPSNAATTNPTTTTGLGLESSTRFDLNHPNLQPTRLPSSHPSTLATIQPTEQQISTPYLTTPHSRGTSTTTNNNNQLIVSRRNSFDDHLTSPRLDSSFNLSTRIGWPSETSSSTSIPTNNSNPSHLFQRPSPSSSHPFGSHDLQDPPIIKQPHKVINANSPQPGGIAPTNATSPRRSARPKSMPILGLSFNLTRSISAFPDLNPIDTTHHQSSPMNSAHPGFGFIHNHTHHHLARESGEDRLSSSNSQTISYIPDHPDSALWTPSSGLHDLPHTSSSICDEFEYSPRTPFSYKSYFKRAYLTESNWLRGPGELIAMQISQNHDGHEWVVTSLGFDDDWIVVGMATSKIHIFSAHTGEFHQTLSGHELGVWCLALVSKGGIRDPRDPILGTRVDKNKGKKPESKLYKEGEDVKPSPTSAASNQDQFNRGIFMTRSSPIPHNTSTDWVSTTYNPSIDDTSVFTNGVTMVRTHGFGINTWKDRLATQQPSLQAPSNTEMGSVFQSAASVVDEHPPPLQVWSADGSTSNATSATTTTISNDEHPFHQPLAPPPSFSRIPPAPSSSSSTVLDSSDLRHNNSGTSRLHTNTRATTSRMTPLGFDYRRPRRPSSFSSFKTTSNPYSHSHSSYNHNDDYTYRSTSYQSQYGIHGTPGGMGLGAGGPSAGNLQQASACGTARGWGQKESLVVSGGCDRDVRVWDVMTGQCQFVLHGHSSTIRCLKVLDGRPIAVSGSRDSSLRVWDIEQGVQKHVLLGHTSSVRAIEVHGNRAVSGSYDTTCRLWDLDTGECLKVLRGHYHQIYAIAFDGVRIASGSMDSTVCIWSAVTGELIALLQGHTALVGQVQINGQSNVLVTGGSDGRVVIFSLDSSECIHRLCAHDNSVTCLQFDDRFVVTGGNDGRVKLWDFKTGHFIRELAEPCEAVWRITLRDDKAVLLCKREGKTVMELISFRPPLD